MENQSDSQILNDDNNGDIELVDMNEIIKCNVDSWDDIPDETLPVISQEIKLEAYNFLGNRINYEEDCAFDDDSFHAPEHYFNTQHIQNYESEDADNDSTPAKVVELKPTTTQNGIINLTDDNSTDDDDVMIVMNTSNNTSGKETETSNSIIRSQLVSIRSDHNYSSQEVCIGSPTESSAPNLPIDDATKEDEELIADQSVTDEVPTENEAVIDQAPTENQAVTDQTPTEDQASTEDQALTEDQAPTEDQVPATQESDSSVSDYIMSEDHSEPLEYRAQINEKTKNTIGDTDVAMEEDLNLAVCNGTSDLPNKDTCEEITQTESTDTGTENADTGTENADARTENIDAGAENTDAGVENADADAGVENVEADAGTKNAEADVGTKNAEADAGTKNAEADAGIKNADENEKSVDQCAQENPTTSNEISNVNVSVELNKNIMNEIENTRSCIERVLLELTSFSQLFANNSATEDDLKKHSTDLTNAGLEVTKSIKAICNIVDAEVRNNVAEDKARKLNDKSKKRWLASSSEDISHSEESTSESPIVRRRKRRPRILSTLKDDEEEEDVQMKTNKRKNVLLDSSDSESDRSSIDKGDLNANELAIEQNDGICSNAVEKNDDIVADSTEVKEELIADTICDKQNPVESQNDLRDIDMSKYFLPPEKTDVCKDEKSIDDVVKSLKLSPDAIHSDMDVTINDEIAETSIASDFEMEEFLGFDDYISREIIPSPLNDDTNQVVNDQSESLDKICGDVVNGSTEADIMEEDNKSDVADASDHENDRIETEPVEIEKDLVESQEWDLNEDPVPQNGDATSKEIQDEQQPRKDNENDADDEKEEDMDMDTGEDDDYDSDREIDRLVDLSTIPTKSRPIVNYVPVYKKKSSTKPKPKDDILDIIKGSTSQELDSESSESEEIMSEEQYVLQQAKQRLLESSDEESTDNSDSEDVDGRSSIDQTDESNDSKLNTFLKKRLVNEINDQFQMEHDKKSNHKDDLVNEVDVLPEPEPETEEMTVYPEPDTSEAERIIVEPEITGVAEASEEDDTTDEPELELQSSGIFEPEIELRDGDKLSEKNDDSDGENEDEISQDAKSESSKTEEKKKWKLDKIAFNKNLFNDLDDDKDSNPHVINSDNSDCEVLDVSMFKTKNTAGDLDKIIQNQKKRDVVKSSKLADECISLSSDSDLEVDKAIIDDDSEDEKTTTKSRPMLRHDQLAGETKQAQKEETERLKRLEKKIERLTQIVETQAEQLTQSHDDSDIILDFDTKRNVSISVHPEIVKNLKEHQIAGVKFMYDCCYGSVDSIDKHVGSGCILAHCMGLGKTLQLIALLHTLIRYPQLKTKKILVICPKSTVMNWADEISTWLKSVKVKLKVLHFPDASDINKKLQILREWHSFKSDPEGRAGCLLIGYEAFRSLVFYYKKPKPDISPTTLDRIRKQVEEYLLKPGADLVVCDEGHVIKNRKSTTSLAVNQIKSRRRIILTGTPIQNNLKEYYSMVNFIKPSFLGTEKEFANLYENPIKEGQHKDSDKHQIRTMKQRSYVLHKKLSKFVQRREAALLKTFLPEKYEYVLFIPMTELQNRLYQYFLDNNPLKEKYGGKSLIPDYTFLRKIWTHPKVLENAWKNAIALRDKRIAARKRNMEGSDEEPDDVLDNQTGKMSVENDWWRQFIEPQDLRSLLPSNKLRILFEILKLCQQNGEKCLIFSAFVAVLDVVEYFMKQINNKNPFSGENSDLGLDNFYGPWEANKDYYRLDGKTTKSIRHLMIQRFNDPTNKTVKCFLISAKAGGQGINLTGANRVILLDTSWNPSNDQQNIFRVFRLGQQRKCYIYRLLAMGTMEEKVYSRSVTKQAMSFRVVDEQQIDRHYSMAELAELYTLTIPDPANQPSPIRPADNILANLLRNCNNLVFKYHEHDSLLENNSAEDLNEQEKADAWAAYENDVSMKNQFGNNNMSIDGMYNNPYGLNMGMNNMINPYSFIPSNLPSNMISSYLQRYQTGVEQELLLMSQMYQQYNPGSGPASYGALGSVFNSPPSGSTNPLFNSPSSSSTNYFKSNMSPITTSSASAYSNNMTTSMSPSVFNGIGALSTSQTPQNMMYNLSRLMPSYAGLSSSSNQASTSRPTSSSIAPAYPPSYNLYGGSSTSNAINSAQSTAQPGPNAIKNPLLSNLLPPPTSNTKDPFSIPTSVITKASKDHHDGRPRIDLLNTTNHTPVSSSPTQQQGNRSSSSTNAMNQLSSNRPSSAHSNHSNSPSLTMTKSMTTPRASPSPSVNSPSTARSSPSAARSSPSAARSSPSAARIQTTAQQNQRKTTSQQQQQQTSQQQHTSHQQRLTSQQQQATKQLPYSVTPKSITLPGNPTSPEANIIVKDVTSINRSVEKKGTTITASPKTSAQIKNFNMGIVYPAAVDKKPFDLQNEKLLRAAQDQLNSLRTNAAAQNGSAKTGISIQQQSSRPMIRPIATSRNAVRMIDKNVTSSVQPSTKTNLASTLPTNEVTITPTRRVQKVVTPATTVGQQKNTATMSMTPSMSRKPTVEVNKSNNLSLSSTVSRLPASTSITRQTTMPISGSTNTGRVSNAKISKQMPALSRQGSLPTLKLISQSSPNQNNNAKQGGFVRTTNPIRSGTIAGNVPTKQIPRVVTTNTNQNGVNKSIASIRPSNITPMASGARKAISLGSIPKLVNFPTSSTTTKRKFEDMIPLSSGVTLTKKPRTNVQKTDPTGIKRNSSFSGLSVQSKTNPRPKESQSSVEIVELD